MNNIKISVIIPIYNTEKYLEQCLDSVLNQNFREIELICVNDGSTDLSPQILEKYAQKDERVKVINKKNEGCGPARETGIENAQGEYISFIDSDDWVKPKIYEILYQNAIKNDSDLVFFDSERYDEQKDKFYYVDGFNIAKYMDDTTLDFSNFTFNYKDIKPFLLNKSFAVWAKLYKTSFLKKYDFYFPIHTAYEDIPFHVQCILRAKKISFCPDKLYVYRTSNEDSLTKTWGKTRGVIDIITIVNKVEEILNESDQLNEHKYEFLNFKIAQLTQWLDKSDNEYKNDFFKLIKNDFQIRNSDSLEGLNELNKNKLNNILNAESYKEFKLLNKIYQINKSHTREVIALRRIYEDKLKTKEELIEKEKGKLKAQLKLVRVQKHRYEHKINNQAKLIEKITSSNSWKLTKPLRNVSSTLKLKKNN